MKLDKTFRWISTLYFAEGLPYVIIMTLSVVMYKRLGISNTDIALCTGWLYLPWVIKPFWGPMVDIFRTKRWWIVAMQLFMGAGFAGVAFVLPLSSFLQWSLSFFWLLAFASATNDIASDGFYMLALDKEEQAFFVGIRSTFYRIGMIFAQGGLVIFAGKMETYCNNIAWAWSCTFIAIAVLLFIIALYHRKVLPHPVSDNINSSFSFIALKHEFIESFVCFFRKPGIGRALFFILTYRLGEAQLVKMVTPFLLDPRNEGGMALSTAQVGVAYGTLGVLTLIVGGILGGIALSRKGLKYWIWPMALALSLPNVVYLFLAYYQPDSLWITYLSVMLEQFGYGFGFTAYMVYLMNFSEGKYATSHYAFCTGFMALGMMLPGMFSGWMQENIGYTLFFVWVLICTLPGLLAVRFLKL
ncbi:MAG: MFS transporter [Bacteroidales bacterium]|nr:MFS transporter [Bacteroidales bacterium]